MPSTGRRRDNGEVNNGKNEEQNDHSFCKRSLGFVLLFVCAAEEAKTSRGCWIHGDTELGSLGKEDYFLIWKHYTMLS